MQLRIENQSEKPERRQDSSIKMITEMNIQQI